MPIWVQQMCTIACKQCPGTVYDSHTSPVLKMQKETLLQKLEGLQTQNDTMQAEVSELVCGLPADPAASSIPDDR